MGASQTDSGFAPSERPGMTKKCWGTLAHDLHSGIGRHALAFMTPVAMPCSFRGGPPWSFRGRRGFIATEPGIGLSQGTVPARRDGTADWQVWPKPVPGSALRVAGMTTKNKPE